MLGFGYAPDIIDRYPTLNAGVILAQNMQNGPTPPALHERYAAEQQAVIDRIGNTPLSEIATLAAWRRVFSSFGVNPTKYRSAPEALLRRLTKKGDIPGINTLVDINNLVSIRYGLPVATFDTQPLQGKITVRFANGSEPFTPLFETTVENPDVDEVIFTDEVGLVVARRWCWRQAAQSAAQETTHNAVIVVEAQHARGRTDVEAALGDLLELLDTYTGGDFAFGILGADNPSISI